MNFYNLIYNIFFVVPIILLKPFFELLIPKFREREQFIRKFNFKNRSIKTNKIVWVHSASMGEFEQVKPIIESIKAHSPDIKIICTFYSPSGYNNQKNYIYADEIMYLPFDTKRNVKKIVDYIQPDIVIFVRYDLWFNLISYLFNKNIALFLISASLTKSKFYRKFFKGWLKNIYNMFNYIYTMTSEEYSELNSFGIKKRLYESSDPRFDRIIAKVNEFQNLPFFKKDIFREDIVFVAGSIWTPDAEKIYKAIQRYNKEFSPKIRIIYVPHEPTQKHINDIQNIDNNTILLSEINLNFEKIFIEKNIIIDKIGILLQLYANADYVYVGGGFGAGVHSITEPAGYGLPIICGPKYNNSSDANNMHKEELIKSIKNEYELYDYLVELSTNREMLKYIQINSKEYVFSKAGSSKTISEQILKTVFSDSL